jgi:hypothetical protein
MSNITDDVIAFTSGGTLTFFTFMNFESMAMAALLGLIGGFFGLAGRYLFHALIKGFKDNE